MVISRAESIIMVYRAINPTSEVAIQTIMAVIRENMSHKDHMEIMHLWSHDYKVLWGSCMGTIVAFTASLYLTEAYMQLITVRGSTCQQLIGCRPPKAVSYVVFVIWHIVCWIIVIYVNVLYSHYKIVQQHGVSWWPSASLAPGHLQPSEYIGWSTLNSSITM